jgi:hypothetical protein
MTTPRDWRRITSMPSFELRGATVDLADLRAEVNATPAQASTEILMRAADRFRGEFLDGLDLPDCNPGRTDRRSP